MTSLLDEQRIGTSLLSTHGPVVLKALEDLLGDTDMARIEKGSTWSFDLHGHEVTAVSYLSPPAAVRAKA